MQYQNTLFTECIERKLAVIKKSLLTAAFGNFTNLIAISFYRFVKTLLIVISRKENLVHRLIVYCIEVSTRINEGENFDILKSFHDDGMWSKFCKQRDY